MNPRRTWIALLLVVALLIAGCGGGNGDDSTASTAAKTTASSGEPTKAELIEQGDGICAKVYATTGQLNAEGTVEEAVRVADLRGDMVKSLMGLGKPQEAEKAYSEFISAARTLAQAEGEIKLAAKQGDSAARELAESSSLSTYSLFQGAAAQYGFKECSEG